MIVTIPNVSCYFGGPDYSKSGVFSGKWYTRHAEPHDVDDVGFTIDGQIAGLRSSTIFLGTVNVPPGQWHDENDEPRNYAIEMYQYRSDNVDDYGGNLPTFVFRCTSSSPEAPKFVSRIPLGITSTISSPTRNDTEPCNPGSLNPSRNTRIIETEPQI